ncbi:MAG: right-handed parallel beta-helix repeat-containing protein [Bacteroidota bacterium]
MDFRLISIVIFLLLPSLGLAQKLLKPQNWEQALAAAEEGATLKLAAGTFVIDKKIVLDKALKIIGKGTEKTHIQSNSPIGFEIRKGDFLIKDLSISAPKYGVDIKQSSVEPSRFANVRFCQSQNGIGIAGENVHFQNCQFEENEVLGAYVYGGELAKTPRNLMNITFEACHWANNAANADVNDHAGSIKIIPNCAGVYIRNCRILDSKGIWFDGCHGGHIIENNYVRTKDIALHIELSGHMDSRQSFVRNNTLISETKQGFYISASSHVVAEHNLIIGPRGIDMAGLPRANRYLDGIQYETMTGNQIRYNVVFTSIGHINQQPEAHAQRIAEKDGLDISQPMIFDNLVEHNFVEDLLSYGKIDIPPQYGLEN